jgi:hypothetical protein
MAKADTPQVAANKEDVQQCTASSEYVKDKSSSKASNLPEVIENARDQLDDARAEGDGEEDDDYLDKEIHELINRNALSLKQIRHVSAIYRYCLKPLALTTGCAGHKRSQTLHDA